MVVFDEVHLMHDWGTSFRDDYLNVKHIVRQILKPRLVMMMTATITQSDAYSLMDTFEIPRANFFCPPQYEYNQNLRCTNISVESESDEMIRLTWSNVDKHLLQSWRARGGTNAHLRHVKNLVEGVPRTIIFCKTRKQTELLVALVGPNVASSEFDFFHAGAHGKKRRLDWFKANGGHKVMCATSAFGYGVDVPNVTKIIILGSPRSVSEYVQYAGRGGRGGCGVHVHVLLRVVNKVDLDMKKDLDDLRDLTFPFTKEQLMLVMAEFESKLSRNGVIRLSNNEGTKQVEWKLVRYLCDLHSASVSVDLSGICVSSDCLSIDSSETIFNHFMTHFHRSKEDRKKACAQVNAVLVPTKEMCYKKAFALYFGRPYDEQPCSKCPSCAKFRYS